MNSCFNCGSDVEPDWVVCQTCGKNLKFTPQKDKRRNVKYDKISKYYDLDTLTQERIDSELTRLHKEIEELEYILIDLEGNYPEHPEKLDFYQERDKVRDQLDAIYGFLFGVNQERFNDFLKDSKLRTLYSRLPDWRIDQLKIKMSCPYYHFKFKIFND